MAKTGYRYNKETLSFDRVEVTVRKRMRRWLLKLFSSFSMAVVLFLVYNLLFPSPKETALRRENGEISAQYDLLGDEVRRLDNVLADLKRRDENLHRVIFETEPVARPAQRPEIGWVNHHERLTRVNDADLIAGTTREIDTLAKIVRQQRAAYEEISLLARNNGEMLASIPTMIPVALNTSTVYLASAFGTCIHPFYKMVKFHRGIDFSGPIGTPVRAAGRGTISGCGNAKGIGNYVLIDHGFDHETLYAHLEKINVRKGQRVERGDVIGLLGNSGQVAGPHLHYEVLRNGQPTDPVNYFFNDLSAAQFDALVEAAGNTGQSMD
ncbi:MAG: M23 family metallopeptidase [Odoribacteraceae bacterium]|nr:M23 family metallopeptidase [Odoribacteraceae bacterium]